MSDSVISSREVGSSIVEGMRHSLPLEIINVTTPENEKYVPNKGTIIQAKTRLKPVNFILNPSENGYQNYTD